MPADLFDRAPVRAKAEKRDERTTPCPLCRAAVEGIDPMRTCERCRATGAPVRVPWEIAKPADSATSGEQVVHLQNAGLIDAPLPSESSIKVGPHPAQLKLGEAA